MRTCCGWLQDRLVIVGASADGRKSVAAIVGNADSEVAHGRQFLLTNKHLLRLLQLKCTPLPVQPPTSNPIVAVSRSVALKVSLQRALDPLTGLHQVGLAGRVQRELGRQYRVDTLAQIDQ